MKHLESITLTDQIDILCDCAGYCREIDRYILGHMRSFVCDYRAYYFLTEEQFQEIKEMQDKFKHWEEEEEARIASALESGSQERIECTDSWQDSYVCLDKYLNSIFTLGCEAGADYIRDYICSQKFRTPENPLPSRWGPFLYEDEMFYFHFYTNGKHYAVPPHDFTRMRYDFVKNVPAPGSIEERTNGPYEMIFYNGDPEYAFVGKEVKEFEGFDDWTKNWAQAH